VLTVGQGQVSMHVLRLWSALAPLQGVLGCMGGGNSFEWPPWRLRQFWWGCRTAHFRSGHCIVLLCSTTGGQACLCQPVA
jgi:hypothetical protein